MQRQFVGEIIKSQNNKCKICNSDMLKPVIDHCHKTGKFRGVICSKCNTGIGMLNDSLQTLESAVEYLKTHSF